VASVFETRCSGRAAQNALLRPLVEFTKVSNVTFTAPPSALPSFPSPPSLGTHWAPSSGSLFACRRIGWFSTTAAILISSSTWMAPVAAVPGMNVHPSVPFALPRRFVRRASTLSRARCSVRVLVSTLPTKTFSRRRRRSTRRERSTASGAATATSSERSTGLARFSRRIVKYAGELGRRAGGSEGGRRDRGGDRENPRATWCWPGAGR